MQATSRSRPSRRAKPSMRSPRRLNSSTTARPDYSVLDINTLVADNSWNAGVVLGKFVPPPARLDVLEGIAYQDGTEIARGHGADALGHPFVPLAWLANHLAANGRQLRKGDIVMTGSIVTTRFPTAPFTYRFDVAGLGERGSQWQLGRGITSNQPVFGPEQALDQGCQTAHPGQVQRANPEEVPLWIRP